MSQSLQLLWDDHAVMKAGQTKLFQILLLFSSQKVAISFFPCKYNACSEWPWNLIKMNLYDYILYSRCSEVINIV